MVAGCCKSERLPSPESLGVQTSEYGKSWAHRKMSKLGNPTGYQSFSHKNVKSFVFFTWVKKIGGRKLWFKSSSFFWETVFFLLDSKRKNKFQSASIQNIWFEEKLLLNFFDFRDIWSGYLLLFIDGKCFEWYSKQNIHHLLLPELPKQIISAFFFVLRGTPKWKQKTKKPTYTHKM